MNSYFLKRATVRKFSDTEVSDSLIKELLESACHAPTTGSMQLYSVIVTRDNERKAALASAHFSQPAYMNAPVILTFCADFNRFSHWCTVSQADPGFDNIQSFVAAALDTTIIAQQFVTLAEMAGLGTCYLGTTTYNPDKIISLLNLPKLVVPITTLAVGYPAESPAPADRLSTSAFIHDETYKSPTDLEIKEFYAEKEALEESQRFIAENGKKSLAQVFTDVRYPRSNNEHFSTVFINCLKSQGFL